MHNRSLIFTVAALASACLTSVVVGCGSSSNGTTPGNDSGTGDSASTTEGGGDDSSTGNPEAGTGDSSSSETSTGCVATMPAKGTPILKSATASAQGVTADGQVVYLDGTGDGGAGTLSAIPVAGGTPAVIGPWDSSQSAIYTSGNVLVYWNGANQKAAPFFGTLSVWTAAHGMKTPGAGKSYLSGVGFGYVDISADGTQVLYTDNATASTADIYVAPVDGSAAPTLLQAGVTNTTTCSPYLHFAGKYAVIGYCPTAVGDAGAFGSTIKAFSSASSGWGTATTFTTGAASFFTTDSGATNIGWHQTAAAGAITGTGLYVSPLTGMTAATQIDATGVLAPTFTSDGASVLYLTGTSSAPTGVWRSTVAAPAPEQIAAGAYIQIVNLSPDDSTMLLATQSDSTTGFTDLYVSRTTPVDGGSVLTLASTPSATTAFGPAFTADGKQALFIKAITMVGSGYVGELDHLGVPVQNIGSAISKDSSVWLEWTTTGEKVLYNDNYGPGGTLGYANIESVDLSASPVTATPLVVGADANFWVTSDKKTIVYSWSSCTTAAPAGIYTMAAP